MEREEASGFAHVVLQVAGTCVAPFIGLEKHLCPRKAVQGRSGGEAGAYEAVLINRTRPLKWEL